MSNLGGITPRLIELANVADISLKQNRILALTSNGELYASKPYRVDMDDLTRVRGLEAYHILQISAGDHYCLLRCTPKSE